MKTNVQLSCYNCGNKIDVDQLLVSQFRDSIKKNLTGDFHSKPFTCQKKTLKPLILGAFYLG